MSPIEEVKASETSLRAAMLTGDADMLDRLLDDELLFTLPDGQLLAKADDLSAYRSGLMKFDRIEVREQHVRAVGECVVVTVRADIAGCFDSQPFTGRGAYTRVWQRGAKGWTVAAGHCSINAG